MENEIIKYSDLKFIPASFSVVKEKPYPQVELVVKLLQKHIDEKTAITKEDICFTYAQFKCLKTGYYYRWCWQNEKWGNHKLTVPDLIKDTFIQYHSIVWFKNVLGMAIIRGKLLVIPVIDLEENKITITGGGK